MDFKSFEGYAFRYDGSSNTIEISNDTLEMIFKDIKSQNAIPITSLLNVLKKWQFHPSNGLKISNDHIELTLKTEFNDAIYTEIEKIIKACNKLKLFRTIRKNKITPRKKDIELTKNWTITTTTTTNILPLSSVCYVFYAPPLIKNNPAVELEDTFVVKKGWYLPIDVKNPIMHLTNENKGDLCICTQRRDYETYLLKENDILIKVRHTPSVFILKKHKHSFGAILAKTNYGVLRVNSKELLPDFLFLYLLTTCSTKAIYSFFYNKLGGMAMDDLRKLSIPVPNLEIQKKVIRECTDVASVDAVFIKYEIVKEEEV